MKIKDIEIGTEFLLMNERMVLLKKNECRALIRPAARVHREFVSARTGDLVEFNAPSGSFSVSPGTEVV